MARAAYASWGAAAKVRQLDSKFPDLLASASSATEAPTFVTDAAPAALDMATVLKLAHAISSEIRLDELLRKLSPQ